MHLLGRALWRNGDIAEAQTTLARCVKLTAIAFENQNTRARTEALTFKAGCHDEWLLYQGDFETAAKGFENAMDFEEHDGKPMFDAEQLPAAENFAQALEAMGEFDEAREAYLEAAEAWDKRLSPHHPRSNFARNRAAVLAARVDPLP